MPKSRKRRSEEDRLYAVGAEDTALPAPRRFRTLDEYLRWFERLVERSGGALQDPPLKWNFAYTSSGRLRGLVIYRQQLHFGDGTVLVFSAFVNSQLDCPDYSYHYQSEDGELIWRFDKHGGHGRMPPHVHNDPSHPDRRTSCDEVDLGDVLMRVNEYQHRPIKPR